MYGYGNAWWDMGGWIAMVLFMLVFWGAVIAAIVFFVRHERGGQWPTPPTAMHHHDAERILGERFARGEIDETEYLARRAALRREE